MSGDASVRRETTVNDCNGCHAEPRSPGQRVGRECHAAYMREWRKKRVRSLSDAELQLLAAYRAVQGADA